MTTELKQQVCAQIDRSRGALIQLSHTIHALKETGFNEFRSAQAISDVLQAQGFECRRNIGGLETAFIAGRGSAQHPHVALLAEYDALPAVGHGCGHNIIAACAVGAFLGAASAIEQCGGRVSIIGTPAEENGAGKATLIENGVFDDVDYALMIHPSVGESIVFRGGRADTNVIVTFTGKAAHSASPSSGINALSAAINLINNIDLMRPVFSMQDNVNGIITQGGTAPNVIPDHAVVNFSVRSDTTENLEKLVNLVVRAGECAAKLTRCKVKFDILKIYAERYPNKPMCEAFKTNMELLDFPMTYANPNLQYGSSDIGNVSILIPAIHDYLSISDADMNAHTAEFAAASITPQADDVCILGAKGLAMTAVDILTDEKLQTAIRQYFEAQVPGGYAGRISEIQKKFDQISAAGVQSFD